MGISLASYQTNTGNIQNAYLKIERVWGGPNEGWNAWMIVLQERGHEEVLDRFHVNVPWNPNENPMPLLYEAAKGLEGLHIGEVPREASVEEFQLTQEPLVVEDSPKKKKTKKSQ